MERRLYLRNALPVMSSFHSDHRRSLCEALNCCPYTNGRVGLGENVIVLMVVDRESAALLRRRLCQACELGEPWGADPLLSLSQQGTEEKGKINTLTSAAMLTN